MKRLIVNNTSLIANKKNCVDGVKKLSWFRPLHHVSVHVTTQDVHLKAR
jgi:hypothetical protein